MTLFTFKPTARVGRDNELAAAMQKTLKTAGAATFSCAHAGRARDVYEAGYRLAYCGYYVTLETTATEYRLIAKKFFVCITKRLR